MGGYHEIRAHYPKTSEGETQMNIGRFRTDGLYHLLGYFNRALALYFSSASESNMDIGIVRLPEGKKNLSELVRGDVFEVHYPNGKSDEVEFIRS